MERLGGRVHRTELDSKAVSNIATRRTRRERTVTAVVTNLVPVFMTNVAIDLVHRAGPADINTILFAPVRFTRCLSRPHRR